MKIVLFLCSFFCVLMNFSVSVFLNENGQYEDLIINVDSSITNFTFLNNIQEAIKSFSEEMGSLTMKIKNTKTISIKNVILILHGRINISTIHGMKNFAKETLKDESLPQKASILIGPPSSRYGNAPYTLHLGGCGQPGEYIHLTPDIFGQKQSAFGNTALVLLHEWAHYRWGMFDEYVGERDNAASNFYFTGNKTIKPIGCPDGLKGWLATAGDYKKCQRGTNLLPQPGCQFHLYYNRTATNNRTSLLMGYTNSKAVAFCESGKGLVRHNPITPSFHNLKCRHKSAVEIFKSHSDFKQETTDFKYDRKLLHEKPPKITVLVRDFSEKNSTILIYLDTRLEESIKMKVIGAKRILSHYMNLPNFNLQLELIPNITRYFRDQRENNLTSETDSIWIVQNPEDSEDNYGFFNKINFLYPSSIDMKNKMNNDAKGSVVTFPDRLQAFDVANTILENVISRILPKEDLPVLVHNQRFESGEAVQGSFTLDSDCGKAIFIVNKENRTENYYLEGTLHSPEGKRCGRSAKIPWCRFVGGDSRMDMAFEIMDTNETRGKWKYEVTPSKQYDSFSVIVVCSWRKTSIRVISRIFSKDSNSDGTYDASVKDNVIVLSAALLQGMNPVLNATVSARVHSENNVETNKEISLYDDGIGSDIVKNDGIYTTEFFDFKSSGLFSFSFLVNTNNSEVLVSHKLQKNGHANGENLHNVDFFSNGMRMPNSFSIPTEEDIVKLMRDFGQPKTEFSYEVDLQESNQTDAYQIHEELHFLEERELLGGILPLKVDHYDESAGDRFNPGQVSDLKVIKMSYKYSSVTLEWTSVGDDSTSGNAARIELKYSTDGRAFPIHFHNHSSAVPVDETNLMDGSSLRPLEPRTKHEVVVKVPKGNQTYPEDVIFFFAMIYYDEEENMGEVSNVAVAFFKPANYSEELKELYEQRGVGGIILMVFVFFLLCLGAFICAVKWYHRHRQYGINREANLKLTNTL